MAAVAALTAAAAEPQAAEKTDSLHVAALSPEEAAAVDSIAALRLRLAPKQIESIFDTNDVVVLDTLDSGNDAVQVVLYSNNTWKYVRNREGGQGQHHLREILGYEDALPLQGGRHVGRCPNRWSST